jgi:hypothetical protein
MQQKSIDDQIDNTITSVIKSFYIFFETIKDYINFTPPPPSKIEEFPKVPS